MESHLNDQNFVTPLVEWYNIYKRDLPWRLNHDAYRIWVSEIMLQQTKVEAVIPFYENFLILFPNISALANASEDAILKSWQGLGYYSRVRNMQHAAKEMVANNNGQFPTTREKILALKGIGEYTASAIASIAFNEKTPVVDGNVLRVLARLIAHEENVLLPQFKRDIYSLLLPLMPDNPGDFNQAMMDLGATVCIPSSPKCEICPVKNACLAKQQNKQDILPIRELKTEKKIIEKYVFILLYQDEIAIKKRGKGLLANLYELPNIDIHPNASISDIQTQLAKRYKSLQKEDLQQIECLGKEKHVFTHLIWNMPINRIRLKTKLEEKDLIWIKIDDLKNIAFPTAFNKLFKYIDMI